MANDPRNNFPVLIGARRYVAELSLCAWQPIAAIRQAQDNSGAPGEQSLNQYGIWKRTRRNFILGAGQEFADEDEESLDLRYHTSLGIDPWDDRKLKLLNGTERKKTTVATSAKLAVVSDRIYWLDGGTLRYETSPTSATGFASSVTGTGYTGLTQFGDKVYVCDGANIYSVTGATRAAFSTYNADMVLYGNGRLVASSGAELVEIDSGGTSAAIWTHPNSSWTWRGGAAAPNGIYVYGDAGGTSEIYFIGIIDADTSLAAPFTAAPLTPNEQVTGLYHYGGVIVISTTAGFRLATITGVGHLTYGPLVQVTGGVNDIVGDGEDLWFTWSDYDGSNTGLGRTRLDRFTKTLVPRYSSDLMAASSGDCLAVCSFGGRRYFVISGDGIYGETTTKVSSGVYNSGWVTFGTPEKKGFLSLDVRHEPLPAGASILGSLIEDDTTSTAIVTSSTSTSLGTIADITGVETESVQVQITLNRATDTTADVEFRRWTLRSIPMPYRSSQIILALHLNPRVSHRRSTRLMDVKDDWDYLRSLEASRSLVTVTMGDFSVTAYVDGVGFEQGMLTDWAPRQTFPEGIYLVRLVTVESTA